MKKEWVEKKLGDLFDITSSKRVYKSEWKREGVPFYRAREIVKLAKQGYVDNELFISEEMFSDYSSNFGFPKAGDIMVTGVGTLGICYVVKQNDRFYFKDGNIIWLKKKSDVNSRYIEYAFQSNFLRKQIDNSVGATVGTYTIIKAKNTRVPIPPRPEQRRIVAVLDQAFEAIDQAIEKTEKNLQNAQELFESYLDIIFSKSNNNWEEKRFGDLCNFVRGPFGSSLKKAFFVNTGYAVYEQSHAINDQFEDVRYFIDDKKFEEMKRFEVNPGDLIMSCSGTMGKIAIVPNNIQKGIINQALLKITPSKWIGNKFLKYWMESSNLQNKLIEFSKGAAIKNIASVRVLKNIYLPLPPLPVQRQMVTKLDTICVETKKLEGNYQRKLSNLEELRQSFLHKAFAGGF